MELRSLGEYQNLKLLGHGALGSSYLAEQRFTKKSYVIKLLPEELATDEGFLRRFEEEVRLLAALDHPHLVKIHTVSQAQGRYFLVSDPVVNRAGESTNLAQYMLARGRRLDEEVLWDLLKQLAEALDYAHGLQQVNRPLIHRGVRLNNILLLPGEGGGLQVFLSDFGLSRIVGVGAVLTRILQSVAHLMPPGEQMERRYPSPPLDREQQIQLHHSFHQAYAFLAPEQKRMDQQEKVGRSVDAYAMGVLAYYLITGEAPEAASPFPGIRVEDYRLNWNSFVQACMQRHPAARPVSLVEALEALRGEASEKVEAPAELAVVGATAVRREGVAVAPAPILRPTPLRRPETDLEPMRRFQIDPSVTQYTPQRPEIREIQPVLIDMVVIPQGIYMRGSSSGNRDEGPRHKVTLDSFAVDVHPVTNEQFVRFLEAMGGEKDSNHRDLIRLRDARIKRSAGKLLIESGYQRHPVVGVTWYGATAYASWVGKRLPTEAEWEVVASGAGASLLYPTGENIEKHQANFFSSDTTPVMSYPPTALGIFDLAGNVYEWCQDWYDYTYYEISVQEPENPKGPLQGVYRVLRGGCWKSLKEDLRCSRRHRNNPGAVNSTYGFRCAADVGQG